jgi:cytochrome b6-f complex iron-sulfur subunit
MSGWKQRGIRGVCKCKYLKYFNDMNLEEKINRNDFLKQLGFTGASLLALYTLDSCQNESNITPSGTFSLDLAAASNANLAKDGGYVINNSVVIARVGINYIAATLICSHEGREQITFKNGEWYCTAHGARFDTTGKGLNSEGKKGLFVYNTSLSGNTLTITA